MEQCCACEYSAVPAEPAVDLEESMIPDPVPVEETVTFEPEPVPEPVPVEETSGECVNDESVVDSYGDTCTDWYNSRPETCGDYDTDTFVAADACCMCQWDDLSTWATEFEPDHVYLDGLFADNFIVVFTKDECIYCHYVQNYANSIGFASYIIDFDDLSNENEAVDWVQDYLGNDMVPAVFTNGHYLGGWTQF